MTAAAAAASTAALPCQWGGAAERMRLPEGAVGSGR